MSSTHISHHLFVAAAGHDAREERRPVTPKPPPPAEKRPVVMDLELLQADSQMHACRPVQPWIRPAE